MVQLEFKETFSVSLKRVLSDQTGLGSQVEKNLKIKPWIALTCFDLSENNQLISKCASNSIVKENRYVSFLGMSNSLSSAFMQLCIIKIYDVGVRPSIYDFGGNPRNTSK